MLPGKLTLTTILTILFYAGQFSFAMAQKDATLDVKKPEKYENRILGSDKTFTTKYTIPRRLMQSMSTHYNFFFNGNVKLGDVIAGAKHNFTDDFTQLLPFYNYTLEATSSQKTELDSVVQKCNAGILLHDLRNEWIDDLYLLMGKAYFFQKKFDSAAITFQYLNYYFQPKTREELGFKKFVGSNLNDEGNIYSVSTEEKTGIVSKVFSEPPGRNDALVWQLRNYIEDSAYGVASALVQTLKRDVLFPGRLKASLEEMQAYLFYKNKMWDSAANHLIPALSNAEDIVEKSRWEYLIGQLFALSKKTAEANTYFDLCIKHTIDPVMELYARLNKIKLVQSGNDEKIIDENVKQLLKMARRDKYYNYRNIIYYMAAQMEMERNNFEAAKTYLFKSVRYNNDNLDQRNRSFLYLGDLAFEKKEYELAFSAYDSLDINSPVVKEAALVTQRKDALRGVITYLQIIKVEDSLQKIAAMPETDREKYVKAAAKRLRKERGLKETESLSANINNPFANKTTNDIFSENEGKGEWYFDNNSRKSKGFTTFRNNWGTRPNADNWRRIADITAQVKTPAPETDIDENANGEAGDSKENATDISYEGLMKSLPLTPEAVQLSNDTIQSALFALGKSFKDKFENYEEAIKNYEALLNRFPNTRYQEEAIFDLHYCYTKLNLPVKAKQYRQILAKTTPHSKYIEYIDNPKAVEKRKTQLKDDATNNYEEIYNLFLQGKFEEAIIRKAHADSIYGNIYWSQQLLYIEAIYYIKQRDDNSAINALQNLIHINREAGIAKKAENIIDVLKQRDKIEKYLTNLEVKRVEEDSINIVEDVPKTGTRAEVEQTSEPKSAEVSVDRKAVIKPSIDSSVFIKPKPVSQAGFSYNPLEQHYVAVILYNVDIVYGNEAKNAFSRYNRETFYDEPIAISLLPLDEENKLMLMSGFSDASSALDYVNKTSAVAGAQVVPWLAADKYSFMVISAGNLEVLKNNKDLKGYIKFVELNYPGK